MSLRGEIIAEATRIVDGKHDLIAARKRELAELKVRVDEIEAEIKLARSAPERFSRFPDSVSDDAPCPRCWDKGIRAHMKPIATPNGGSRDNDYFRCINEDCGYEVEVLA